MNKKRNIILIALVFITILSIAIYVENTVGYGDSQDIGDLYNNEGRKSLSYNGKTYLLNDNIETYLILGIDHFNDSDGDIESQQADFLFLVAVDNDAKSYTGLMINRDTMTDIKTYGAFNKYTGVENKQVALSHAYGSDERERCKNTRWAIENLLFDISIDKYISLTMDAVPVINSHVGGVTVTINDDFSNIDQTLINGKTIKLNDSQALNYVRSREGMSEPTNLNRMERQKSYTESLISQLTQEKQSKVFYQNMLTSLKDYMVTNCNSVELADLCTVVSDYEYQGITNLNGENKEENNHMAYYVNDNDLKELIIDLFYEKE